MNRRQLICIWFGIVAIACGVLLVFLHERWEFAYNLKAIVVKFILWVLLVALITGVLTYTFRDKSKRANIEIEIDAERQFFESFWILPWIVLLVSIVVGVLGVYPLGILLDAMGFYGRLQWSRTLLKVYAVVNGAISFIFVWLVYAIVLSVVEASKDTTNKRQGSQEKTEKPSTAVL